MKKTILTFGLISGSVSTLMMGVSVLYMDHLHGSAGYVVGYTGIVLSFLLVYFGIRSYRDRVEGGQISFGKAFVLGISITLISCVFYVVTWEIVYFNFLPHFLDNYGNEAIAKLKASGASAAAVQAQVAKLQRMKELYQNPLYNAAMTFLEPFPVGLVMTLISAGLLRRKTVPQEAAVSLLVS